VKQQLPLPGLQHLPDWSQPLLLLLLLLLLHGYGAVLVLWQC
jgi:hypothetical protein